MHYTFWIPLFLWCKEGKHPAPQKLLRSILIRYLMMITSNCWSANKMHEHREIVRFCHSVADLAWKHHWNKRKFWNNMFSVIFLFFLVFASKCAIDACFAINLVQKDDLVFLGAKEASGRKLPAPVLVKILGILWHFLGTSLPVLIFTGAAPRRVSTSSGKKRVSHFGGGNTEPKLIVF